MKLKVYQVSDEIDSHRTLFLSYDSVIKTAGRMEASVYKCVFDGELETNNLERVFQILNTEHVVGYNGHSLSVSDVVDIENDGCYFCDSIGFKKLDDFDASKIGPVTGYRMLVLEPHKAPYGMVIPKGLESLQQAVGGLIECTYPFEDNAFVISNEESKLIGLEGNRRINGEIYAGPMLIAADDGYGGTIDLTDEQMDKYACKFGMPEEISPEEVEGSLGHFSIN